MSIKNFLDFKFAFLIIFFVFTQEINAFSKNTKFKFNNFYENQVKIKNLIFDLPEGKWRFIKKTSQTIPRTNLLVNCHEFIIEKKKIVSDTLSICLITTGGKWTSLISSELLNILKNDKYDNCRLKPEYYYAQLISKGTSMNCFKFRHIDTYKEINFPDDPTTRNGYFKNYLQENKIGIPKVMIGSYHFIYSPTIKDLGIEIIHFIDPESYGAPKTLNGDELFGEYHKNNIDNFLEKKIFVKNFFINKIDFHKNFENLLNITIKNKLNFENPIKF